MRVGTESRSKHAFVANKVLIGGTSCSSLVSVSDERAMSLAATRATRLDQPASILHKNATTCIPDDRQKASKSVGLCIECVHAMKAQQAHAQVCAQDARAPGGLCMRGDELQLGRCGVGLSVLSQRLAHSRWCRAAARTADVLARLQASVWARAELALGGLCVVL